jgi:acetolactate decarboxylase
MTPAPVPGAAVTQFAVIDALLAGAYESGLRVAAARSIGDFGLGCVDHLGGEVVIVGGEAIECTLDGPPAAMDDDDILPFAIVCRFPDVPRVGLGEQDFAGFAASVEGLLTSRNLFHAVRFDGVLSEVRVRITPRQHHRFPRLAEVTSHQVETVARDIRGTVVGFWTPAIYQGIAVAGLHLHFLSEDRSIGGHLLDLAAESGDLPGGGLRSADGRPVPPHRTHPRRGPSHRRGRGRCGGIRRGTVLIPNASEAGAHLGRRRKIELFTRWPPVATPAVADRVGEPRSRSGCAENRKSVLIRYAMSRSGSVRETDAGGRSRADLLLVREKHCRPWLNKIVCGLIFYESLCSADASATARRS